METVISKSSEVWAEQQQYIFDCVKPFYAEPLVLSKGSGSWVTDADGDEYLDVFAGILTTSLGHCHPRVVEAVQKQAARLGHISTLYVNERQVEGAKKLTNLTPGDLNRAFFTNSGSEAVEMALALARQHTGRTEVVALRQAYHGRTSTAQSVTANSSWRPLPNTVAGVTHALSPYPYRAPFGGVSDEELVEIYAKDLIEVIETTTNGQPAAFIAESLQGVGGYIVPPKGYFQRIAEVIRSYGGLFICDEVQSGFGRTGDHWFAIEHWDTVPDIMVMAKGIAGGFPVGATVASEQVASSWEGNTISTFGGNPISMAAMSATLDVMVEEDVPQRARARGDELRAGLDDLARDFDWFGEVRGMGLMQAIELVEDRPSKVPATGLAAALLGAARNEGLLVGKGGLKGHVIRMGPSLLISADEVSEALERLARACRAVDVDRA